MSSIILPFEVKYDLFCWRCCIKDTTLKCTNCVRTFHNKCTQVNGSDVNEENDWICPVCTLLKANKNSKA